MSPLPEFLSQAPSQRMHCFKSFKHPTAGHRRAMQSVVTQISPFPLFYVEVRLCPWTSHWKNLLPIEQQLTTVQQHESVNHAIDLMCQRGFGQLPVVGPSGDFAGQVVTFDSILLAVQAFRTDLGVLVVRDVGQRAEGYPADADLLRMLEHIHRDNFAVIVDGARLKGIVTTADATVFFQSYAQDLMRIESIESSLKDAICSIYSQGPEALKTAIIRVTDRDADVRANLSKSIKALPCNRQWFRGHQP